MAALQANFSSALAPYEVLSDEEIARRVHAGETALYEILMRRYNQRLYRVARAILHNDAEAEDVMQDAYVRAYEHLDQFAGRAPFAAWLTRIAVHEALTRLRLRGRNQPLEDTEGEAAVNLTASTPDPEQNARTTEVRALLEEAVLSLPENYRVVVMLRDVEEMTTAETAAALELSEDNVKVRLHRGHGMVRNWLLERVGTHAKQAFPFMGARCNRVVEAVLSRLSVRSAASIVQ